MDQTQVLQLRNVFSAGCIVDILVEACANVIFVNNKNKTIKENKCFPSPCMDSFIDGTLPVFLI